MPSGRSAPSSATARSRKPISPGEVAARARHLGRRGEPAARRGRQARGHGAGHLLLVAAGRLEVQADDRVGLRQLGAEALQPRGVALVQAGPRRLRQRRVGDLAHEAVAEADRRAVAAHEQVAHDQALAGLLELGARDAVGERVHLAHLERVPHDRAEREHGALRRLEPVQAGGEQRVQRGWKRLRRCAALAEPGDELLEEERVAAGRRGDPLALGRGQASTSIASRSSATAARESGPSSSRQSPPAKSVSQPRWRSSSASRRAAADDEHGRPAHPLGDVGEQLHECGLGQVRVVEHEHERSPRGRVPRSGAGRPTPCPRRRRPRATRRRRPPGARPTAERPATPRPRRSGGRP